MATRVEVPQNTKYRTTLPYDPTAQLLGTLLRTLKSAYHRDPGMPTFITGLLVTAEV